MSRRSLLLRNILKEPERDADPSPPNSAVVMKE